MQGDMALPANMAWGEWRSLPRVFAAAQPLLQRGQALQGLPGLTALAHTAGSDAGAMSDAVRYLANRSSGRQGYTIAEALAAAGARALSWSAARYA
jgi:phosphopantothenoylcysteine decarboxylase/phosphopantothenate--cysteine ligase